MQKDQMKKPRFQVLTILAFSLLVYTAAAQPSSGNRSAVFPKAPAPVSLEEGFQHPPDDYRPGVYWYFMDGNLSKASITRDLESMKRAGIGYVTFLEVNVGVPRGPVDFLGDAWKGIFTHAVREAERLGICISLGTGPGWAGSGGPWVTAAQSMQHLVHSDTTITGAGQQQVKLAVPLPKKPFFGEGSLSPALKKQRDEFYRDVAVLAWPAGKTPQQRHDADEKALYYRAPYSSAKGVKPFFLPAEPDSATALPYGWITDLTRYLQPDGTLNWKVPAGIWTIMRFGSRNNGAVTRPAPLPGLGFEEDKFDTTALNAHLDHYIGSLIKKTGGLQLDSAGGLKMLHIDSWEMGAQNWTGHFREEFKKRRGYDPLRYYPVYAGVTVGSPEISERFLWDLRQTAQELIFDYHVLHTKQYAHRLGLGLSVEPYDMNPTADLALGALADVTMCEFWNRGKGFNTNFSCMEATSVAHVNGQPLVPAEAFTSDAGTDGWQQHPATMKNQGDWAFAAGINRFVFHTFQNQYLDDKYRPGMTMGPYGVHWDRNQTWWPMVNAYHTYLSRCQFMLQQGRSVADILYLAAEDAPHVFLPPPSALTGDRLLPDRRGYNFDGCAPSQFYRASVKDGRIVFPGGASYRILVLPIFQTMTIRLLKKIHSLLEAGAVVMGVPPTRTPGLSGFPETDQQLRSLAEEIWGTGKIPSGVQPRKIGRGRMYWGEDVAQKDSSTLYPAYQVTAGILRQTGQAEDFVADGPFRYTHRVKGEQDIYFVSNTSGETVSGRLGFRVSKAFAQEWNPVDGSIRAMPQAATRSQTTIPLSLAPYESRFIIFQKVNKLPVKQDFRSVGQMSVQALEGPWTVSFDTAWGGPASVRFDQLSDWSKNSDSGIRYYSGIATYRQHFLFGADILKKSQSFLLDLGEVNNMARVKLNGQEAGTIWTSPWTIDIGSLLKNGDNELEIEVANLWTNRLIGDAALPDDGIKDNKWPDWLLNKQPRPGRRYTFSTYNYYKPDAPLSPSGLLGPVVIRQVR